MKRKNRTISLDHCVDDISLTLDAFFLGNDLNVSLAGGDRGHIAAVAVSQPRASLANPEVTYTSTSVITLLGHKEDLLARSIGENLSKALNVTVCVACGIHVDNITPSQIRAIESGVQELASGLLEML